MPEDLRQELEVLVKKSPIQAMARLHEATGCCMAIAKAWSFHKTEKVGQLETLPCPQCGKPLRTDHAKQCRFCDADWH